MRDCVVDWEYRRRRNGRRRRRENAGNAHRRRRRHHPLHLCPSREWGTHPGTPSYPPSSLCRRYHPGHLARHRDDTRVLVEPRWWCDGDLHYLHIHVASVGHACMRVRVRVRARGWVWVCSLTCNKRLRRRCAKDGTRCHTPQAYTHQSHSPRPRPTANPAGRIRMHANATHMCQHG
jgi:hypothetical protein